MWRMRIASSGDILHLGGAHHLVTEMAAQVLRRTQVNGARPQQGREVRLDLCQA